MHIGQTDTTSAKCLINSISRFIHLVSCQTMKPMPLQKNCNNMVDVLKRLKPVLDDVVDYKIFWDENLYRECEELDMQVNEAREFFEKWGPNVSKIHSLLQSGELLIKLQSTAHKICLMIVGCIKSPALANIQHYMQELQSLKKEPAFSFIEEALRNQRDNIEPSYDHLKEIVELLKFTSNKDLLKESIAVEKERLNGEANKKKGDMDQIYQIVNLVCSLRDYVMKIERTEVKSGVLIPPYFRCPLSLELMADPVIVASGQTYERKAIQKWLDHGLTVCPMTHQRLVHTNLITNYTVKAMISNWCEENNIKLTSNSKHGNSAHISSASDHLLHQDFDHACSFESLDSSNSNSNQTGRAFETKKDNNSFRSIRESNRCQNGVTDKFEQRSPAPSCNNSRSESFSSSISSNDYVLLISKEVSGISNKHQNVELSGEITNGCPTSTTYKESGIFPWLSGNQFHNAGSKIGMMDNGNKYNENNDNIITSHSKVESHHVSNFGSDELITTSHVNELIEDLHSESYEAQTAAAEELRLRTKNNVENRIVVGRCGAIMPLLSLLYSDMKITQEHAVTALLNLSINEANKALIMEAGAVEPLIHVLQTGNDGAKENSAAALFSLSVIDNNKVKIGRSGAVKVLVDLLASGTLRGKKDAATALFNLSIFHENKARIVQAGAVKFLVLLLDPTDGMVDKAVALLANLSTIAEGQLEIAREGGISLLVEIVESGSQRGKENAASILLQLCLYSRKFCTLVLQEGAVPPLVALSQSGTPRAREKAQQLLSHFRNQREGATGKGKS